MITKNNVVSGVVCGSICVLFMWVYSSFFMKPSSMDMGMNMENMNHDKSMENMMMDMTARMKGKTGTELEKVFLEDMIVHHQGAVDMSRELLIHQSVTRPELIKFANDIITNQTKEIEMQKAWLKTWYSNK